MRGGCSTRPETFMTILLGSLACLGILLGVVLTNAVVVIAAVVLAAVVSRGWV